MTEIELIKAACMGDPHAVAFCVALFSISQTWDDLVDNDKPVAPEAINRAFFDALITLPENPFYAAHVRRLTPVVRAVVNTWLDANELQRGTLHERTLAFVLRDRAADLLAEVAYLLGGADHMRRISLAARRLAHSEPLEDYLGELP